MSSDLPRPDRGPLHRRLLRVGALLAGLALLWTLGLGWLLPRWAQPRIQESASAALGVPVRLEQLRISPWRLAARLEGLSIGPAQAGEPAWLTLGAVDLTLSMESVWRLAPVLASLTLTEPRLYLERQSGQRLNVSPLIERLRNQPASNAEPTRFAVHNIRLEGGSLLFKDQVLGQEHRIDKLRIGIPFVSNLPSHVAVDVQPLLEAHIDGSPLRLSGRTRPFAAGHRSEIDWHWQDVDLPRWAEALAPLLPPTQRWQVGSGRLSVQGRVIFEDTPAGAGNRKLQLQAKLNLDALQAHWPARGLDLRLAQLSLDGIDTLPLQRQAGVQRVRLSGLQADWDLAAQPPARPAAPLPAASSPASAASAASAPRPAAAGEWAWRIGRIEVEAPRIALQPVARAGARARAASTRAPLSAPLAWPVLGPVTLQIQGLDSRPQAPAARLGLDVADATGARLNLQGELQPARLQARLAVQANQIRPADWLRPWAAQLPVQIQQAQLDLKLNLDASPARLQWQDGEVQLQELRLRPTRATGDADRLALTRLQLTAWAGELALDGPAPALRRLQAQALNLNGLDVQARRLADGSLPWLAPLQADPTSPQAGRERRPAGPAPAVTPAAITLAELNCEDCRAALADEAVTPTATWQLDQARLRLHPLSADLSQPVTFELDSRAQRTGRISLAGKLQPQPLKLSSRVGLRSLDLRALQPYLDPYLNATLATARVDADTQVQFTLPPATDATSPGAAPLGADWSLRGKLALNDLRAQDRVTQADFLRWRNLSFDGLDLVAARRGPIRADLGRIALSDFYGRIIISPEGQLNLAQVWRREGETAPRSLTSEDKTGPVAADASADAPATPPSTSPATPPATPSATPAPTAAPPPASRPDLRWQAIRLTNGRVDFTDNFIRPNYSARLTDLAGEVSAVAAGNAQPASVRLAGKVDGGAPVAVEGELHPLGPRLYTDIRGSATGVELTRLTPYAARYAGYAIEKGTLTMTVQYQVADGKLQAQNRIFLDQLTFGEKVDSPDATSLPLQLAVALLKNSRGEIDINLPISGSLDDPEFSLGGVIVRVIVNLLTKAITAPFSLLASAFGGDEELGYVEFEPGRAELDDAARKRLDTLAAALADRPALKLEVTGQADPATDAAGLRQAHLRRLLRAAKARATGDNPAGLQIEDAERNRWLEAAYKAADIKKPRNLIGLAKTLPPAEMEALLLASAPADEDALRALANRRGDRVKAYLANKLPPERVLLTASRLGTGDNGQNASQEASPSTGRPGRAQFAVR